jgi:hypothetical protein
MVMKQLKESLLRVFFENYTPSEDVYNEISSELHNISRKHRIDLNNIIIINTNRQINSPQDIKDISVNMKQWAGYGLSWFDWIRYEMPHWLASRFYMVQLDTSKVLQVTPTNYKEFAEKYIIDPNKPKDRAINYKKLYDDGIGAISFKPYKHVHDLDHMWYDSIDMDSVVIVNNKIIKSVK